MAPGLLSSPAKASYEMARALACGRNQNLSTLHVLYGVLGEDDCAATLLLRRFGLDIDGMRNALRNVLESDVSGSYREGSCTVELETALRRSNEEADHSNSKIGSIQLMLGFLTEETLARLFLERIAAPERLIEELRS